MAFNVGICAYNEEAGIGSLLKLLTEGHALPADALVIVVCSGCTDRTIPKVKEYAKKDGRVILIEEPKRKGKVSAINVILANSWSEHLIMLDVDVRPLDDAVLQLASELKEPGVGMVGARPLIANSDASVVARASSMIRRILVRAIRSLEAGEGTSYVCGEMYGVRRSLIDRLPNDVINDDAYIALKVVEKGYKVKLSRKARYLVNAPTTALDYITQRRRIICGHAQIRKLFGKYATSMEGVIVKHPLTLVKAVLEEMRATPSFLAYAPILATLEAMALIGAFLDLLSKRSHVAWEVAKTTKAYRVLNG